jgi:hypothetical protein
MSLKQKSHGTDCLLNWGSIMKTAPSKFGLGPSLFLSLLLGMALCGCSETSSPDPVLLSIVAGDGQEAQAGTELDSLVVRVTNLDGSPRGQVAVSWTPSAGQGTIGPSTVISDEQGLAGASWTLGPNPGAQVVSVSAQGTDTLFQAWATSPSPTDWAEVLEITPGAEIEGTNLLAKVRILNHWDGTVRLKTPYSCLGAEGYPALFAPNGAEVAHHFRGCWTAQKYHSMPPGDSISYEWGIGIGAVEPGDYTLRFRFDVREINGVPGTLPDTAMTVRIQG